jgi:hypothetical protein
MNPPQAHAILSGAASRALLNEADRFAVIQARDTLADFINQHVAKTPEPAASVEEMGQHEKLGQDRRHDLEKLNGRTKR